MNICPICGKNAVIHWPEFWPYRRKNLYLCSENCLIAFVTKEYMKRVGRIRNHKKRKVKKMPKITLEMKKKAVQIAIDGGDPKAYLKDCGSANPQKLWEYIKKVLRDKDPALYEKIPKRIVSKTEPVRTVTVTGPVIIDGPAEPPKAVKTPRHPLMYEGFKVCCIENNYGRFYWDCDHNHLYWTTGEGEEVSFTPAGWKAFCTEVMPKVMAILGVEAE